MEERVQGFKVGSGDNKRKIRLAQDRAAEHLVAPLHGRLRQGNYFVLDHIEETGRQHAIGGKCVHGSIVGRCWFHLDRSFGRLGCSPRTMGKKFIAMPLIGLPSRLAHLAFSHNRPFRPRRCSTFPCPSPATVAGLSSIGAGSSTVPASRGGCLVVPGSGNDSGQCRAGGNVRYRSGEPTDSLRRIVRRPRRIRGFGVPHRR